MPPAVRATLRAAGSAQFQRLRGLGIAGRAGEPIQSAARMLQGLLALVFVIGALMNAWLSRTVLRWGERLLERVPLVKALYGSVRELIDFFSGSDKKTTSKAVMVAVGNTPLRLIGFITREDFGGLRGQGCAVRHRGLGPEA
jgi:uncharacterized membrane protein